MKQKRGELGRKKLFLWWLWECEEVTAKSWERRSGFALVAPERLKRLRDYIKRDKAISKLKTRDRTD